MIQLATGAGSSVERVLNYANWLMVLYIAGIIISIVIIVLLIHFLYVVPRQLRFMNEEMDAIRTLLKASKESGSINRSTPPQNNYYNPGGRDL